MKKKCRVQGIYIYPVKGLSGISLSSSLVTEHGLVNDRIYMIADIHGKLISQRTNPELALFHIQRLNNSWNITFKNEILTVKDGTISKNTMDIELWDDVFNCHEVSNVSSLWFEKQLGIPCKLMVMPNKETRLKTFNKPPYKTYLSFADGYPVNTLGTKSIALLNQKLKKPIKANRFRSNLIIETNTPHEEDNWVDFKVGNQAKFRNIKPCVRCEVITIDQDLAVKGKEPLTTLATYRKYDQGVCFSSNAITLEIGEIKIGDFIQVLDRNT